MPAHRRRPWRALALTALTASALTVLALTSWRAALIAAALTASALIGRLVGWYAHRGAAPAVTSHRATLTAVPDHDRREPPAA